LKNVMDDNNIKLFETTPIYRREDYRKYANEGARLII
jgi:hypothetical protein